MSRGSHLRSLILNAKHAYCYRGEPLVGDAEFDALEDELRRLSPDDPVVAMVGARAPDDAMLTKALHAMPMGSQRTVDSEDEFRTWSARVGIDAIHTSLKGDGASAAAYHCGGQLIQAISRGDDEDFTANALRFKGLPAWVGTGSADGCVGFTGSVRFEVILKPEERRESSSRSTHPGSFWPQRHAAGRHSAVSRQEAWHEH